MKYTAYIALTIVLIFATAHLKASEPQAEASFEKDSIVIGDPLQMTVLVHIPKDSLIQWTPLSGTISDNIEILDILSREETEDEQFRHLSETYRVTSFDSGYHAPAKVPVTITGQNGEDTVSLLLPSLAVSMVPADSTRVVYDIKPIEKAPLTLKEIMPYLLLILIVAALMHFLFRFLSRRRTTKENEISGYIPKILLPPHIQAIKDLDSLRAEKLWQNGHIKEYHTRLTDIVRVYLSRRFGISAMELTTTEILAALKAVHFDDNESTARLASILDIADLVKFAKDEPLADRNETALLDAYMFVNNTKLDQVTLSESEEPEKKLN